MEECGKEIEGEGDGGGRGEGIAELKDRDDIPLLLERKKVVINWF